MKRMKISLAAVALVVATTGAFATTAVSTNTAKQTVQDEPCLFPDGQTRSSSLCPGLANECCVGQSGIHYKINP